jgi:protein-tyrosine phosphatase
VVVVCHANVARSAAAVHLLAGALDERGVALELRSAGTHAAEGQPASARTQQALRAVSGDDADIAAHRSHQLAASDVAWADLIVTMEAQQVRFIRRSFADVAEKAATLWLLASELPLDRRPLDERVASMRLSTVELEGDHDVDDPAGGGDADYERAMATLVDWCGELASRIRG